MRNPERGNCASKYARLTSLFLVLHANVIQNTLREQKSLSHHTRRLVSCGLIVNGAHFGFLHAAYRCDKSMCGCVCRVSRYFFIGAQVAHLCLIVCKSQIWREEKNDYAASLKLYRYTACRLM